MSNDVTTEITLRDLITAAQESDQEDAISAILMVAVPTVPGNPRKTTASFNHQVYAIRFEEYQGTPVLIITYERRHTPKDRRNK